MIARFAREVLYQVYQQVLDRNLAKISNIHDRQKIWEVYLHYSK